MKQVIFKLSVLSCALVAWTNTYAAVATMPVPTPGFSISLTGYYLQPNASNLQYAVYTHPLPVPRPNWSQQTLNPGNSPGFDLGVQYNFAEAVNKANFDWFYINTDDSTSFAASGANSSVAPPYYFGPLAQALIGSAANTQAKFEVSNAALTFGRLINLGNHIQLDPFAGISVAYLKEDITSTYIGVDSGGNPYAITSYNTSKFTGIGPRLGVDAIYFFTNRLGLAARVGGSLLAGSMRSNTNFNSFGAGNTVAANTTLADENQNDIVPEVDSKLEINYTIPMNQNCSSLSFSLGYLFTAYINGINQVVPTALVPGAFNGGTIAIETEGQNQSNLNLNGPYASIMWKF